MNACNCETDGQRYVCCACCGEYVIEGEFGAHRYSCAGPSTHPPKEPEPARESLLGCRLCQARVGRTDLRDHLDGHGMQTEHLDPDEVRDAFEADSVTGEPDNAQFLGCLAGTVKFGPGWDQPLPPEDWDALRGT